MPLNNCNEAQLCAVKHFEGPMLLSAGPGSGKTFTITERIRYLIEIYKAEPSEILVITFTKAAAAEMEQRFLQAVKGHNYPVNFGTFHAVFFHILKQAYQYNSNNIISEKEKREYLKIALEGQKAEDIETLTEQLLNEFGKVKNNIGGIAQYTFECDYMEAEQFAAAYKKYRKICMENRKMDFDDMALQCLELFSRRKDIVQKWQKRFKYIMIDEFQDINEVQYSVVRFLAGIQKNIFAVGDDDQSIYGFRGANPRIMQKFADDFQAKQVILNQNYRSGKKIIDVSMQIIKENQNRMSKIIEAGTKKEGNVHFHVFKSKEEEYAALVEQLKEYKKREQLKHCAIILRTNQGVKQIRRMLLKEEIPVAGVQEKQKFYEHFIMQDMERYIRFAKGERTREHFLHLMNKPSRFLSRESTEGTESEYVEFEKIKQYYKGNEKMLSVLVKFEKDLELLNTMPPFLAVNYIRKAIGYDEYLREMKKKDYGKREEDYMEIIEKVQKDAAAYKTAEEWFEAIEQRKNREQKMGADLLKSSQSPCEEAVCVLTMHGAKGLEYEKVFLPDLNEGIVPYGKMLSKEAEEEERRIFYVAVTRAKEELEFMCVENEREKRSRFLKNIKESEKEF